MSNITYDKIPELLIDRSTYLEKNKPGMLPVHHTQFTYLFCIILRILIGICIMNADIPQWIIIMFLLIIIIVFGFKYYNNLKNKNNSWKNYQRHVLMYCIALITQLINSKDKNEITGLIIIIDSLMGQSSRFSTTNLSRSAPN